MGPAVTRIALRVERGALVPADDHARKVLRDRDYSIGDVVFAEVRKPRNEQCRARSVMIENCG